MVKGTKKNGSKKDKDKEKVDGGGDRMKSVVTKMKQVLHNKRLTTLDLYNQSPEQVYNKYIIRFKPDVLKISRKYNNQFLLKNLYKIQKDLSSILNIYRVYYVMDDSEYNIFEWVDLLCMFVDILIKKQESVHPELLEMIHTCFFTYSSSASAFLAFDSYLLQSLHDPNFEGLHWLNITSTGNAQQVNIALYYESYVVKKLHDYMIPIMMNHYYTTVHTLILFINEILSHIYIYSKSVYLYEYSGLLNMKDKFRSKYWQTMIEQPVHIYKRNCSSFGVNDAHESMNNYIERTVVYIDYFPSILQKLLHVANADESIEHHNIENVIKNMQNVVSNLDPKTDEFLARFYYLQPLLDLHIVLKNKNENSNVVKLSFEVFQLMEQTLYQYLKKRNHLQSIFTYSSMNIHPLKITLNLMWRDIVNDVIEEMSNNVLENHYIQKNPDMHTSVKALNVLKLHLNPSVYKEDEYKKNKIELLHCRYRGSLMINNILRSITNKELFELLWNLLCMEAFISPENFHTDRWVPVFDWYNIFQVIKHRLQEGVFLWNKTNGNDSESLSNPDDFMYKILLFQIYCEYCIKHWLDSWVWVNNNEGLPESITFFKFARGTVFTHPIQLKQQYIVAKDAKMRSLKTNRKPTPFSFYFTFTHHIQKYKIPILTFEWMSPEIFGNVKPCTVNQTVLKQLYMKTKYSQISRVSSSVRGVLQDSNESTPYDKEIYTTFLSVPFLKQIPSDFPSMFDTKRIMMFDVMRIIFKNVKYAYDRMYRMYITSEKKSDTRGMNINHKSRIYIQYAIQDALETATNRKLYFKKSYLPSPLKRDFKIGTSSLQDTVLSVCDQDQDIDACMYLVDLLQWWCTENKLEQTAFYVEVEKIFLAPYLPNRE